MTRVLVTGSSGLVGGRVVGALRSAQRDVVPFDLTDGQDIRDPLALEQAMAGCTAVVHSAALLGRPSDSDADILEVNLRGTQNVLSAAAATGVRRVVFLSSVDVLGVFKGERAPDYLPLDDAHPCRPTTPYGISKLRAEALCARFAEGPGRSAICLRPPGVWTNATYGRITAARAERPSFEWDPFWEYGAFLDVRDLAQACILAADLPGFDGFASLLVCAPDVTTSGRTSRVLVADLCPEAAWRGDARYDADPFSALIDCDPARRLLGWEPRHGWNRRPARPDTQSTQRRSGI